MFDIKVMHLQCSKLLKGLGCAVLSMTLYIINKPWIYSKRVGQRPDFGLPSVAILPWLCGKRRKAIYTRRGPLWRYRQSSPTYWQTASWWITAETNESNWPVLSWLIDWSDDSQTSCWSTLPVQQLPVWGYWLEFMSLFVYQYILQDRKTWSTRSTAINFSNRSILCVGTIRCGSPHRWWVLYHVVTIHGHHFVVI